MSGRGWIACRQSGCLATSPSERRRASGKAACSPWTAWVLDSRLEGERTATN